MARAHGPPGRRHHRRRRDQHPPRRVRHLDLGVRAPPPPAPVHAVRAARAVGPAARPAGPAPAVRGHRRRTGPDRRPQGVRPRRPGTAPGAERGRRRPSAGSTSGWTPPVACHCRCRCTRRGSTGRRSTRGSSTSRWVTVGGDHGLHPAGGARIREAREAEIVLEAGRRIDPVPLPGELAGLPRMHIEGFPRHRPVRPRGDPAGGRAGAAASRPGPAAPWPSRWTRSATPPEPGWPPVRSG